MVTNNGRGLDIWLVDSGVGRPYALCPYVCLDTASVSHFLKISLSLNCLNSCVSSQMSEIITRPRALSSSAPSSPVTVKASDAAGSGSSA